MSKAPVRIPGDDDELPASRAPAGLLNNAGAGSANDVGQQHERTARAMAMADAVKRGEDPDLAPPAAIGQPAVVDGPRKRMVEINGVMVETVVQSIRRNADVANFGPESRLPAGTPVKSDGTPCEGDETATHVIGDIILPHGRLVGRMIPVG